MPELPEVEVTRRGLLPHLHGRKIIKVAWSGKRLRLPVPRKLLQECIAGNRVRTVDRRAKYLLIRMEDGAVLVIHLGMTGKLGMFPVQQATAPHDHVRLQLDNGMEMRFNDARRFGSISVWPPEDAKTMEQAFNRSQGIEPFGPDFTPENLAQLAQRRRIGVKKFLMNSRIIAGIGNIYANETLFAASIHPETPVHTLSNHQWQRIITCCLQILDKAIEAGGSTISDFLGSSGEPGYFQLQLAVYGRKDLPCPECGRTIIKKEIGGRASYFCPDCQPRLAR
jgi:formamidopyrimidine-DNA glycosylase